MLDEIMFTSKQLDISSRFGVNQIPPLNVKDFSERSLQGPGAVLVSYNLHFLLRCLMKAGKWGEFYLKLEVTIWSNFLLAMSRAGWEEGGQAGWLAGPCWPV